MNVHGFQLDKDQNISELRTKAKIYTHTKTKAKLLSMENNDDNKVFGVTFRTPPINSTGVSHILEHSVLCGSYKYPVKEPFKEMLKGSLKTFLNAFTYPDKTCYPVASQNTQDFYNLIDVYLDAVFYPLLSNETFQQEGWHYELKNSREEIFYKGVVFNEMKGAYSDTDNLMEEYILNSLFPNHTYGIKSGGDPKIIPNLTWQQLKNFHKKYYHPSNSYIYFYGNDDPEQRLKFLANWLDKFDFQEIDSTIQLAKAFKLPNKITSFFPSSENDKKLNNERVTVNWVLPSVTSTKTYLDWHILSYILIGTPGSPLRKELIESGLGEDLIGIGLENSLKQMIFSVGLKGVSPEKVTEVEKLIFSTLNSLVTNRISQGDLDASLNTIEFDLRENTPSSGHPQGLEMMLEALTTWLYGEDPLIPLTFEKTLNTIKNALHDKKPYFENLISEHLLNNSHRTVLIMKPDTKLLSQIDQEEKNRLAKIKQKMGVDEIKKLVQQTQTLDKLQNTPDSPENLAKLPTLKLKDLEKQVKIIPMEVLEQDSVKFLYHDIFTHGIIYLDIGFNLKSLPLELMQYVPLFSKSLINLGTQKEDYVKLSQKIGKKTGGISPYFFVSSVKGSDQPTAWLFVGGKCLPQQVNDLLQIVKEILLDVKFNNQERFRQILLESKARMEASIIPAGHQFASTRLKAQFNNADWINEQIGGTSYLSFLYKLIEDTEYKWPKVLEKLNLIKTMLINRNNILVNATMDMGNWSEIKPNIQNIINELPTIKTELHDWQPVKESKNEGLIVPSQVNYLAKGINLYDYEYNLDGSIMIINLHLRNTWLWEKIRMQGGAYGAFCGFDLITGTYSMVSYRDPNLQKTLDIYDQTVMFLKTFQISKEELTKSIIGTLGEMDRHMLPEEKGHASMMRYLTGITDNFRQQLRDQIMSAEISDFHQLATVMEQFSSQGTIVIVGNKKSLSEANQQNQNLKLQLTQVI